MRSAALSVAASLAGAAALAFAVASTRSAQTPLAAGMASTLTAGTSRTLSVFNANERSAGHAIGDSLYPLDYIVQVGKETTIEVASGVSAVWRGSGVADDQPSSSAIKVTLMAPGDYSIFVDDVEFTLSARRVRWELRQLDEDDRERYFQALHTLYTVDDATGQEKYGPKFRSMNYLIRKHLYGAADRECDHWHDDAGFANHHIAVTLEMEEALVTVDPTVAAHYWDYTQDANATYPWFASVLFTDDWFGQASVNTTTHVLNRGRWAYTEVMSNARSYSNTTNPYGLLRSPWNTNRVPYLGRSDMTLYIYDNGYSLPTCTEFADILSKDTSLSTMMYALNGYLHGTVHLMIGGFWGTNSMWQKISKYLKSGSELLLLSKFLWRQGYIHVPEMCSHDTPASSCVPSCPESIIGNRSALEVLNETGVLDLSDSLLLMALESTDSSDDDLLTELCHVGYAGEMFTSAAPQDPIFWPLHGNAERFLQYARYLSANGKLTFDETWNYVHEYEIASDTGMVYDWSSVKAHSVELPTGTRATCPGHKEHDTIPFDEVLHDYMDSGTVVDNAFFYNWTSPFNGRVPYVYDSLSTWPACTGSSIEVERSLENVHAKATTIQANRESVRISGFKKTMSNLGYTVTH